MDPTDYPTHYYTDYPILEAPSEHYYDDCYDIEFDQDDYDNYLAEHERLCAEEYLILQEEYQEGLELVSHDGLELQHIENELIQRDPTIQTAAVNQNGLALQYVDPKDRTPEICLLALKQNAQALEFCPLQTSQFYRAAITQDSSVLRFIPRQTLNICLFALGKDPSSMQYIREQSRLILYLMGIAPW